MLGAGPQDKGESANVSMMTRNWHWHWTVTVDWHPRISHWLVSIILVETLSFSQLNALVWGHTLQTAIIPVIIHHIGSYWYICCYIRLHYTLCVTNVTAGHSWNNNGLQFVVREELKLRISGLRGERLFSSADTDRSSGWATEQMSYKLI